MYVWKNCVISFMIYEKCVHICFDFFEILKNVYTPQNINYIFVFVHIGKVKQLKNECYWQGKKNIKEIDRWKKIELETNVKYVHFYKENKT